MAPPPLERSERLNVRAAPEEMAMLEALADDSGLSVSDVVRMLVRDAYRSKFGDNLPKPKK